MLIGMETLTRLAEIIERHVHADGIFKTSLPGVSLIRSSTPTMPMPVLYEPAVCIVAQGRKRAVLGRTTYLYDTANCLVASVDLPVVGTVVEASLERPYLCLQLDLDLTVLSELVMRHPDAECDAATSLSGLSLNRVTPELLDAATRLASLLDTPGDAEALAPLVVREILYRLLSGPGKQTVRQMALASSRLSAIARAIAWLRHHFTQECRIDELAREASMSRSAFHAHFKAVTTMSPLEFRTQLRMQEARRLMVAGGVDAASAAYRVGYGSPSQFSREYAKRFGVPPGRDALCLRRQALDSGPLKQA
jgi:AraC-like DNA-binding protein